MSLVAELAVPPILFRITQGLRTWAEQAALYAQGRTVPGKIVTDAPPGSSWHNYGLAFDIVPMTDVGPDWNITHPVWQRLIAVGESQGLVAGALFRAFPDRPHFQLTGRFPVTPDDEVRQIYENEGLQALWQQANIA
jgi:peptidoglycan LD-endopeptidase CwlK